MPDHEQKDIVTPPDPSRLCNGLKCRRLSALMIVEEMFDDIPDILFFVKDEKGRYSLVNRTLVSRCGRVRKEDVIGKTAAEVYPAPFGQSYQEQDDLVLRNGKRIKDKLELQLYPEGGLGWCLTNKTPIRTDEGHIIGMIGLSKDLHIPRHRGGHFDEISRSVDYIHNHYSEQLRLESLARMASLSTYQFEQRMKKIFHVTAGQFIVQTRINVARQLLASTEKPIVEVALECGFCDQSAFARQFKAVTGLTPSSYRELRRRPNGAGPLTPAR